MKKKTIKINVREVFLGLLFGLITVLFMIGLLPWDMISKIIACIIAMLAILRINKKAPEKDFAYSYIAFIAVSAVVFSLILHGAK
ncbi:MAG: hypothetical protein IJQ50_00080 [Clostridia bacterium]|nr:hypothetical protein [Clostridia bacterium]